MKHLCNFASTNPWLFFARENFFLNQLFYRFNKLLSSTSSIKLQISLPTGVRIVIFALLVCSGKMRAQQDAQFSQNMFNMLSVNPAYAGSSEMINLQGLFRTQYIGLDGKPTTAVAGADMPITAFGQDCGFGLQFGQDQIGFIKDITIGLSGSLRLPLETGVLALGIKMGYWNHVLDPKWYYSAGNEGDDYHQENDPDLVESKVSGNALDFGLGTFFKGSDYYVGLSVGHLFNPVPKFDQSYFYYFKRTYYLAGGKRFALEDKPIELSPSVFLKSDGVSVQTDLNCNLIYKKRFWGGLSYRLQDAVVLLAGLERKDGLRIGFSYDIGLSRVARSTGAIEVSLNYTFEMSIDKKKKQYKSVRYL